MFSKAIFALTISCSLTLTHSHGNAQESPRRPSELQADDPLIAFSRRWDINGDHVYTCDEWRLFMSKVFHTADVNRSRLLEMAESASVAAADPIFSELSLTYFDANGDGVIDRAEFLDAPNPFFVIYDTDKDCRVTAVEQVSGRK